MFLLQNTIPLLSIIAFANGFKPLVANSEDLLRYKSFFPQLPFKTLVEEIDRKDVDTLYFTPNMDTVISENKANEHKQGDDTLGFEDYSTTRISPFVSNYLVETAMKQNVQPVFLQPPQPNLLQTTIVGTFQVMNNFFFPALLLITIVSALRRNNMNNLSQFGGGGGMNAPFFNRGNKPEFENENMKDANITLNSFAGSPEIFNECTEIVSYLKNETLYKNAGAEIPRGILLEGPPGTGKTLLAKAIASEAEANFISIAASEFVEVYVGLGASKIRSLFQRARESKPCIIFIDEIDAVGRQRGAGVNMANDEREQTLNQLLAEMDGFADNDGILIMGATNRKDVLDAALLRPGRFDRLLNVPLPDTESRLSILKVHAKNKELKPDINLDILADLTSGFSGAQLKNLMNEGAIHAAREGNTMISLENLLEALDKVIIGIVKKKDCRDDAARLRVAVHETGHALLAALCDQYFELKKVSIQSTYSGAGGYTIFNELRSISESGLYTKDLLIKRLVVSLGGKAAETLKYGEEHVSVGAVQDLKQANDLAKKMIGNFGMGTKLEVYYNDDVGSNNPFLGRSLSSGFSPSENTKEEFDKESLSLVNEAYIIAKELLKSNADIVETIVNSLLEKDVILGSDVLEIIQKSKVDGIDSSL